MHKRGRSQGRRTQIKILFIFRTPIFRTDRAVASHHHSSYHRACDALARTDSLANSRAACAPSLASSAGARAKSALGDLRPDTVRRHGPPAPAGRSTELPRWSSLSLGRNQQPKEKNCKGEANRKHKDHASLPLGNGGGRPGSAAKSWSTALVQKRKLRMVNQ